MEDRSHISGAADEFSIVSSRYFQFTDTANPCRGTCGFRRLGTGSFWRGGRRPTSERAIRYYVTPPSTSHFRVDVYFTYVHPSFPILHKPTFLTSLLLPPSLRPQTTIILRAIVVSASIYASSDARLYLYAESLPILYSSNTAYHQMIIDYALDCPSLQSLQALTILALNYFASDSAGRLWGIMAILTRLSISMSLQTIDLPLRLNEQSSLKSVVLLQLTPHLSEQEERRRCFWAIFCLDRFLSASTGWSVSISERDIRAKLPCLEMEFQMGRDCPAKHFTQHGLQSPDMETATATGQADLWAICVESAGLLGRVAGWLRGEWNVQSIKGRQRRESDGMSLAGKLEGWWRGLSEGIRRLEDTQLQDSGCTILVHATYHAYGPRR